MAASRSFTVIVIALLMWNLIGVMAFIAQYSADLPSLAKTDPYTARIFAQMPAWVWAAYGTAVAAGTLGATLLLLRKAAAVLAFSLSVLGIVAQFSYSFFGTDLLTVKGPVTLIFPAAILLIAVGQLLYAGRLSAKGLLR
ncbi:sugar transporter [Sphingobium mellinum]|uniref:sugar transporter n=1 Tax=Sphingobium mellinum TaxID=1387166 RepID=UPI0030EF387B